MPSRAAFYLPGVELPRFETDAHRSEQDAARKALAAAWRCVITNRPPLDKVDWDIWRASDAGGYEVKAVGEFKRRHNPSSQYATLLISAAKVIALEAEALALRVKGLLIVQFDDGFRFIDVAEIPRTSGRGGRKPRPGAVHDQEECFWVPVRAMKRIEG